MERPIEAEKNLNDSLRHFEASPKPFAEEFLDLKLQTNIAQYDICSEMVGYVRNQPQRFAASVTMKGMVLRLYEYNDFTNKAIIRRLLRLAEIRGIDSDRAMIKKKLGKSGRKSSSE